MHRLFALLLLASCAAQEPIEYTGETRRFVVDSIELPKTNSEARAFGADLGGGSSVDNQLGSVASTLHSFAQLITFNGSDMIAAGAIESSLELTADDWQTDPTVALHYYGVAGADAQLIGGALSGGAVTTKLPGGGTVRLPFFVDADPVDVPLVRMQMRLVPDGAGGFDATIQGGIPAEIAVAAAYQSITQMIAMRPRDHVAFHRMLDVAPYDFTITRQELEQNSLVAALLHPDLEFDGEKVLTIGFRAHLRPCAEGSCVTAPPAMTCFDRVHDGDETDVDCGGSCGPCAAGAACTSASDCESGSCAGTCGPPSCTNNLRDGLETDVDCGGPCGGCASNKTCWSGSDCASGVCGEPCEGLCTTFAFDTCR